MRPWFRHYVGMTRDEKLMGVAARTRQPLDRVVFVWCCILESASERQEGGAFDVAPDEIAYNIRCDPEAVQAILEGLFKAGRIVDGAVAKWASRQFENDTSRGRMKRLRERQKSESDVTNTESDVTIKRSDVTVRHSDGPEAEADTEKARQAGLELDAEAAALPALPACELKNLEQLCLHGLNHPETPPKGSFQPMAALLAYGADADRIAGILKAEAAKRPKPVVSWVLWAKIVSERLAEAKPSGPRLVGQPAALKTGEFVNIDGLKITAGMAQQAKAKGHWPSFYGPPPGQPGCRIPDRFFQGVA